MDSPPAPNSATEHTYGTEQMCRVKQFGRGGVSGPAPSRLEEDNAGPAIGTGALEALSSSSSRSPGRPATTRSPRRRPGAPARGGAGGLDAARRASAVHGRATAQVVGPADAGGPPLDPGRPALRRLTNLEYDNTIRDLLGVEAQARATFQPDEHVRRVRRRSATASPRERRALRAVPERRRRRSPTPPSPTRRCARGIVTCAPAAPGDDGVHARDRHAPSACAPGGVRSPTTRSTGSSRSRRGALARRRRRSRTAIERVVTALLASAPFLMHVELDPDADARRGRTRSRRTSSRRACRTCCGARCPTTRLFELAADGSAPRADVARGRGRPHARRSARRRLRRGLRGAVAGLRRASRRTRSIPSPTPTFDEPLRDAMGQELRLYFGEFLHGTTRASRTFLRRRHQLRQRRASRRHYGMTPPGLGDTLARVIEHGRRARAASSASAASSP